MDISKFNEKLNKVDGIIHTVEEEITLTDGIYNGTLAHDNISKSTLNIYTGPTLTGDKITNYFLSTPSETPWKYTINILANVDKVYVSYETTGDQVEAEDINNVQSEIIRTQEELNTEINRAKNEEEVLTNNLNLEINRAKAAENEITNIIDTNKPNWDDKYTKEETIQKINDLVNGAPGTLDTLNEIAASLGNDPNFSTTIINLLGNKVDKTTADITYYVNTITGNDSNDGLTTTTAFKTIQYAINKIPQTINHDIVINIEIGIYNENILINGFSGKGKLGLIGGSSISSEYIVSQMIINNCSLPIYVQGLSANTITTHAFNCINSINIIFNYCSVESISSFYDGFLFSNCLGSVLNCVISNRYAGIRSKSSVIFSNNNSGNENAYGLLCQGAGSIGKNGTQPSWIITETSGSEFQDQSIRIY